jgi:hypothetical protein
MSFCSKYLVHTQYVVLNIGNNKTGFRRWGKHETKTQIINIAICHVESGKYGEL